ncbi:septation protein SepH [Nocardia camponoti]|uniref:DUF3071 domain-containing protein n=1 Tax=Nocardia camponoti TaxID=1616106 RepID=A0A917VBR0_9NOCA|nr:septation protein SepH [Nocardia camponoti]GGK58518.1 hypothetical protein GCM10011591_33400 [Nocardia camponoti]
MRDLRVIGVTPDSTHIVCIDAESGTKFRLPADDKLRAAARGDLARFGQIEIETEASMRPRDIQARIRAGASVEQVTRESGMSASKIERFAYPVLLERARAAELAQKAHPVLPDGKAPETLHEVVTAAFAERGHTIEIAEWDAWKDEKGFWVAQLQWRNGHSEIAAHWRYQPDAHGGSVSPLDDPAADLIDPDFGRALRGLATILPTPASAEPPPVADVRREPVAPVAARQPTIEEYYEQRQVAAGGGAAPVPPVTHPPITATPTPAPAPIVATPTPAVQPAAPAMHSPPAVPAEPPVKTPEPQADSDVKAKRQRRGKAPMPSWEDVLLGVRGSGH